MAFHSDPLFSGSFRRIATAISFTIVLIAVASGPRLRSSSSAETDTTAQFDTADVFGVAAGSSLDVPIVSDNAAGSVTAIVTSAAGSSAVDIAIRDAAGSLTLGPPHTVRSGVITIALPSAEVLTVQIIADTNDEQLDINLGPTSIRTDESAMAIGLLTDRWGNPVPDGTTVSVIITDAAGSTTVDVTTRSGLAVLELSGEGRGTQFSVAMSSNQANTAPIGVRVQADRPSPLDLTVESDAAIEADE